MLDLHEVVCMPLKSQLCGTVRLDSYCLLSLVLY